MSDRRFIAPDMMVRMNGPVTKRELDTLVKERENPLPIRELTPGGETEKIIRQFEQERRSVRESYIANRLDRMRGNASNDFALARVKGKLRSDFERER